MSITTLLDQLENFRHENLEIKRSAAQIQARTTKFEKSLSQFSSILQNIQQQWQQREHELLAEIEKYKSKESARKPPRMCRYGIRCYKKKCPFSHPDSRNLKQDNEEKKEAFNDHQLEEIRLRQEQEKEALMRLKQQKQREQEEADCEEKNETNKLAVEQEANRVAEQERREAEDKLELQKKEDERRRKKEREEQNRLRKKAEEERTAKLLAKQKVEEQKELEEAARQLKRKHLEEKESLRLLQLEKQSSNLVQNKTSIDSVKEVKDKAITQRGPNTEIVKPKANATSKRNIKNAKDEMTSSSLISKSMNSVLNLTPKKRSLPSKPRRPPPKREKKLVSYLYNHGSSEDRLYTEEDQYLFHYLSKEKTVGMGRKLLMCEHELASLYKERRKQENKARELWKEISQAENELSDLRDKESNNEERIKAELKKIESAMKTYKFGSTEEKNACTTQINNAEALIPKLTDNRAIFEEDINEKEKELTPLENSLVAVKKLLGPINGEIDDKNLYLSIVEDIKVETHTGDESFEAYVEREVLLVMSDREEKKKLKAVKEFELDKHRTRLRQLVGKLQGKLKPFKDEVERLEIERARWLLTPQLLKDEENKKIFTNLRRDINRKKAKLEAAKSRVCLGTEQDPVETLEMGISQMLNGLDIMNNNLVINDEAHNDLKVLFPKYLEKEGISDAVQKEIKQLGAEVNALKNELRVLDRNFDIDALRNSKDLTLLMFAVLNEDETTFRKILNLGANPVERNSSGQTALFFAKYFKLGNFVSVLSEYGGGDIGESHAWSIILDRDSPELHTSMDWESQLRIADSAVRRITKDDEVDTKNVDPSRIMELVSVEDDFDNEVSCFDSSLLNPSETSFHRIVLLDKDVVNWVRSSGKDDRSKLRKFLNTLKPKEMRKSEGMVQCRRRSIVGVTNTEVFEVICAPLDIDIRATEVGVEDAVVLFSPYVESRIEGKNNVGCIVWKITTDQEASHYKILIEEAEFKRNKVEYPDDIFPSHKSFVLRLGKDMHLIDLYSNSIYDGGAIELFSLNVDDGDLRGIVSEVNFDPPKRVRHHELQTRQALFFSSNDDESKKNEKLLSDVKATMSTHLFGGAGCGKTQLMVEKLNKTDESLKLLVVSRLPRLISAMKARVEDSRDVSNITFVTYDDLMAQLVRHVTHDQVHKTFAPFSHVQYGETTQSGNHDFQIEFYHDYLDEGTKKKLKTLQIEPKTLWTSIRVIKSHTRCSVTKEHLSREEFMALPKSYGLTNDQRHLTYDMYLIYQDWLIDGEFKWDEADRVMYIAKNGESVFADQEFVSWQKRAFERGEENLVDTEDNPLFPFFHLVFVDEAQDFSDFDISLLLRMSGGVRSLFLAGDPAQSVEIGLKMRVGTVNNVIHSCLPLYQHKSIQVKDILQDIEMKDNFRTHAQNLALAKKVREMLKHSFAVQMTKEEAILKGPVPQTMFLESVDMLADDNVFRGGNIVFIAPDEIVPDLRKQLHTSGIMNDVFGVREAKGLEFDSVAVVDFFSYFEAIDNKQEWKDWLSSPTGDFNYILDHPELEDQAMMLYTAITRARNNLYFIDFRCKANGTKGSPLAEFAYRELNKMKLVKIVSSIDEGSREMTPAEHKMRGILFITQAIDMYRNNEPIENVEKKFAEARAKFQHDTGNDKDLLGQCNKHLDAFLQKRKLIKFVKNNFMNMKTGEPDLHGKFDMILKFETEASKFISFCRDDSFLVEEIHELRVLIEDVFFGSIYQEHFEEICDKVKEY